ncbi:MAG: arginase family protein [Glaciihabitans sp.]|nr:arginase family protein [Glaciihabitans sp.]MDQ1569402.1 arginase [Actinomycetota bacterium]
MDGAAAIRGDLPSARTVVVDVPLEAGEAQDSRVSRFTSIQLVRDRQAQALASIEGLVVTVGGDCGVELAAVSRATDVDENVAVVWLDAHPDLNTPQSSPSAAFTGMVLRTLLGEGASGLVPARPLKPGNVVLVGAREFDEPEDSYVRDAGIRSLDVGDATSETVVDAVAATGATRIYIHIDVDVLDPADFAGQDSPVPFGLQAGALVELIRALRAKFDLIGAGLTEFAPASAEQAADDLPTILRIIAALTN